LSGVLIALDRQERMEDGTSAVLKVAGALAAPVHSIVTLRDVISYLDLMPGYADALVQIRSYQQQYCVKS
jgi:orotate phosphoribosyltransferase